MRWKRLLSVEVGIGLMCRAYGYFADDDTGQMNLFHNGMSTRTPAQVAVKLKYSATLGYEGNAIVTGITIGSPVEGLQTFSANLQFNGGVSTL
jgi:hypothetical protein